MSSDEASLSRLRAAEVDGRTQSIRYRQTQLRILHEHLVRNSSDIRSSIQADSGFTHVEAAIEFARAVTELRQHYENLNFEEELEAEYSVAKGKSYESRRVGFGLVYIIPSPHCRFYGIIGALSAAISAGNCCMVELIQTPQKLPSLVRKLLTDALDRDTFTAVSQRPNTSMLTRCLIVHQDGVPDSELIQTPSLNSPNKSRVVAVVDRTADVESAAASLVSARLSFGGQSPMAPDCVLVNEWSEKVFVEAAIREFSKLAAGSFEDGPAGGKVLSDRSRGEKQKKFIEEVRKEKKARIVVEGAAGAIAVVADRTSPLTAQKVTSPLLIVQSVSSLDDSIDLANSTNPKPLLGTVIFADAPGSKYLSQFIQASASFINYLPTSLLIGPAPPTHHAASLSTRYAREMFEQPSPQFVGNPKREPPSDPVSQISNLSPQALSDSKMALRTLQAESTAPLPPTKQSPGGQIGFFEQGLLWGAVLTILPTLTIILGGTGYGALQAYKYMRR